MSANPAVLADVSVQGYARDEFEPLANIFARTIATGLGRGAALAIYRDGIKKVDLVGGDYGPDSLQLQFSVSKAVTAITAAHAESAGRLDLDEPVSGYWKAFDRPSTLAVTPRMILSHTSGLAGVDTPLTIEQLVDGQYTNAVERQEPFWEPGTTHGYHAFSFGPLLDGVFERTTGHTVGSYFSEEIGAPLGLDLWFGVPAPERHRVRPYTRDVQGRTPLHRDLGSLRTFTDYGAKALSDDYSLVNREDVMMQGWPNCNVVCTARDMAKLFAATLGPVDGHRILSGNAVADLVRPRAEGIDWVLRFPIRFGSGVQLPFPQLPYTGPKCFGHEGAGGCVAFADIDRNLAAAYSTDLFPACDGASLASIALFSTIRHLCDNT